MEKISMSWFWYALSASILWGGLYVINQKVLNYFSSIELIFLESIITMVCLLPWMIFTGKLSTLIGRALDYKLLFWLIATTIVTITATAFIYRSITTSNATLASVIEASYPIFTMIFSYLLLGEVQFNLSSLIGSIIVIIGLIILHRA